MTLDEIRRAGLEALDHALGPVSTIRFLQLFELGRGDYTAERDAWLTDTSVTDIYESVTTSRERGQ